MTKCKSWNKAVDLYATYKKNIPKVTYDYLAFDMGKLYTFDFFKKMRLKIADVPAAAGTEFNGESFVFDFKDPKVNPDIIRMYISISGDDFKVM